MILSRVRIGARRAFGVGLGIFAVASAASGLAPTLAVLLATAASSRPLPKGA